MPERMHEQLVSRGFVVLIVLWVLTGALLVALWVTVVLGVRLGGALAATTVISAVVAGTLQIKLYMIRVCSLIRAVHGFQDPEMPPVRRLERTL